MTLEEDRYGWVCPQCVNVWAPAHTRCDVCAVRRSVDDALDNSPVQRVARAIIDRDAIRVYMDRYSRQNQQRIKRYVEHIDPTRLLSCIDAWEREHG